MVLEVRDVLNGLAVWKRHSRVGDRGDGKPNTPFSSSVNAKRCFQLPSGLQSPNYAGRGGNVGMLVCQCLGHKPERWTPFLASPYD